MALVLKDRVLESSTSTGTGSFTLTGAQTGYQSFSAIGNGNTTYYTIQGKNPDGTLTGEWEVGIGTWSTGNTLSRDTVLSNSLGTTANIVFSAGAKDVFCDYPASKSVNQNADNKVLIPYTPGVTNVGSLNVGDATSHSDSGVIAAFTASEPLYLYTSLQNTSSANTSYASYAVNDGGHTSYGELGINNSNYSYSAAGFPNNTFSAPLATFVESYGGPLAIGTWDSQKISFIVNGSVNTADAMTISAAGVVSLGTPLGVASGGTGVTTKTGTGSVVLSDSPTFTTAITSTGALQLTGSDTVAQNIATNQTSGNLQIGGTAQTTGTITIGGTSATGSIRIGQSTGAQTIVINESSASSAIITIGGAGASTGNINIGRSTGTQTISIGSGGTGSTVTGTATRTINIGTTSLSTGISNVNIGKQSSTVNHTTTINGRYVTLNASTTLSLSAPSLALPQNTYTSPITVADLAFLAGVVQSSRCFVTDALAPVFGSIVNGGGAVPVPVYYDGTNWRVG